MCIHSSLSGLKPKRTIRTIFWTGEEVGYIGVRQYFKDHQKWKNETFVFVSESDMGAFRPTSLNATMMTYGSNPAVVQLQQMAQLIGNNGIPISITNSSSPDIGEPESWARQGIPGFFYINMDRYQYYFIFHHTQGDFMTVLKPDDIDYTAALFASFANIIANLDINHQRKNMTST